MDDDLNNPNYIPTAPISVSIEKTYQILEQLKNSIFEIKNNNRNSTGFLCKIQYGKEKINALVMNYKIFDEKFVNENKILVLSFNDCKEKKEVNLKSSRKIYFLKKLDITIIEIKKDDEIKDDNLLELDDDLLKDDSEIFYKDESIYVLQYKDENQASVSYGLIVEAGGNEITIYNDIGKCSLGSPILNLSTNKVIGICKEFTKDSTERKGINFKYVMRELFKHKIPKNNLINEIKIAIKVEKEDINKRIYYMYNISKNNNKEDNNYNHSNSNDYTNNEPNLIARAKSLEIAYYFINDYHPTIYINEKKKDENETNYYFKPTEEKLYTIRIIFTQLITDCSYMFYNCDKIISIDLSSFNSSKVNNMRYMFHGCTNLRYINFTNIITKNVYNMERIFYSCYKLNYLDLSNFDTRNVIYTDFMFYNAKNLEKIIFSKMFDTTNVINPILIILK